MRTLEKQVRYVTVNSQVVVVNKPVGLHTTYRNQFDEGLCVVRIVTEKYPDLLNVKGHKLREGGLLYRLDVGTSGLLIFARKQAVFNRLLRLQNAGRILKRYIAICKVSDKFADVGSDQIVQFPKANTDTVSSDSVIAKNGFMQVLDNSISVPTEFLSLFKIEKSSFEELTGRLNRTHNMSKVAQSSISTLDSSKYSVITYPIGHSRKSKTKMIAKLNSNYKCRGIAQEATTYFRLISQRKISGLKFALVEAIITKGSRHQIRVHLDSVGLPVLGDSLYGQTVMPGAFQKLTSVSGFSLELKGRLCLHCVMLNLAG